MTKIDTVKKGKKRAANVSPAVKPKEVKEVAVEPVVTEVESVVVKLKKKGKDK